MKVVYTGQAIISLDELIEFLLTKFDPNKVNEIELKILSECEKLSRNPLKGSIEPLLQNLGIGHRRIIVGHTKAIYRIKNKTIFITDFFDSRQDPQKMKI